MDKARKRWVISKAVADGVPGGDVWLNICWIVDVAQMMRMARGQNPVLT